MRRFTDGWRENMGDEDRMERNFTLVILRLRAL